jgi:predicted RNA-binding Zn ribbon-like protein
LDDAGLALPEASWPPNRAAPGELETLRRFVNTTNLESGAERWRTPVAVGSWLAGEGHATWDVTESDRTTIIEFREFLRDLASANQDDAPTTIRPPAMIGDMRLGLGLHGTRLTVRPTAGAVDGLVQHLAGIAVRAGANGTWARLKACHNAGCRWVYYDHSKNQRGRWCSMTACGSRTKARAYRARQRQ